MTTDKQIQANQENAKQSTGPKTEEGKAVSRYNSVKHGLLSKEVLLMGEDEEALVELGKRLRTELKPETELELLLIDRIIANTWRLRRAMQVEHGLMEHEMSYSFGGEKKGRAIGDALYSDFLNYDIYGKFVRYESSIERGLYRALHELQRIQAARMGEKPPAPIAIDVDISKES